MNRTWDLLLPGGESKNAWFQLETGAENIKIGVVPVISFSPKRKDG